MAGVPSLLISIMDELIADEVKKFKWTLSHDVPEGFNPIPRGQLEKSDVLDTVDKMVGAYGEEGAVTATLHVLRKMAQNYLAETLEEKYTGRRAGKPQMFPRVDGAQSKTTNPQLSITATDGGKVVAPQISGSSFGGPVTMNFS